jgi:sugar phosphate isomerase/epimerase
MSRDYRLSYSTLAWGSTLDLEACLEAVAAAGWEGIEFINVSLDWLGTPARVRRLLTQTGLEPVAYFTGIAAGPGGAEANTRAKRTVDFAAETGFGILGLVGAERIALRPTTDDDIAALGEATEDLIDHAAANGMTVAHHAHLRSMVESQTETERLLQASPRLKVCLDISVATLMGEDPVAQYRDLRERVAYVHLKDWKNSRPEPLGLGTIDIPAFLDELESDDYRGWVTTELSPYADYDPVEACITNRAYLRSWGR